MPVSQRVPEFLFRLLIPLGALFVMTVLALVMLPFSESRAPLARLLDTYGGRLIAVEVAALAVVGLSALVTDRLHAVRQQKSVRQNQSAAAADAEHSPSAESPKGQSAENSP